MSQCISSTRILTMSILLWNVAKCTAVNYSSVFLFAHSCKCLFSIVPSRFKGILYLFPWLKIALKHVVWFLKAAYANAVYCLVSIKSTTSSKPLFSSRNLSNCENQFSVISWNTFNWSLFACRPKTPGAMEDRADLRDSATDCLED